MLITENQWKYCGALLLAGISSLILLPGVMNIWLPMPIHLVIVAWSAIFLFPFVTPVGYLMALKLASNPRKLGIIVIFLTVLFAFLSALYFYASWGYGVKYQGEFHTKIVALENLIGFFTVLVLTIWAINKNSKSSIYAANLLLFILLSWCAFPYLGELP